MCWVVCLTPILIILGGVCYPFPKCVGRFMSVTPILSVLGGCCPCPQCVEWCVTPVLSVVCVTAILCVLGGACEAYAMCVVCCV